MDAELQQRGQDDGHDAVREKLLRLIEFHEVVGQEMRRAGPGRSQTEKEQASQRLMSCLRAVAEMTASRTLAAADEVLLGDDELVEAPASEEAVERACSVSKRSLVLFDDMMLLYHDMKAQRDAMQIVAFVMLALAMYAFWR
ncbi:uncharacterized protein IUM83_16480 [Phytophthora cinnamomi]|uniref:uncharacterized protein n=1 Tax=Phytophthora cinnamomi TaxID=4785 RepID=UPI00355A2530|nr:hypothetical protein IUM83_16486 [Phytophthora cinnamomi]KAG6578243.1 hypothetical protein IUM83_16480 [Phytophthora cinnamomi]